MKKKRWLLIMLGLALILVMPALAGCSSPATAQNSPQILISQQTQGIWVNGTGEVSVTPDIVALNLGIVAQEATVAEAQARASEAMNNVMQALSASGMDIQTGFFSISQRTRWDDLSRMETITGYQVSNMVTVKIRETDKAGTIIDAVVQAGGDLTRINGISLSVDDPTQYYQEAREKAVTDAKSKAEQLAALAGVTLGKPTFISEGTQYSPIIRENLTVPAPAMGGGPPPISVGETQIILNVQVAYSIIQ
jgi:uncharacterized protein YggE